MSAGDRGCSAAAAPAASFVRRAARAEAAAHLRPARIGIYAFLLVSALFFLVPLYIMIVTSLKGMPEIRLGHLFDLPARAHLPAVGRCLAQCLHRARLQRAEPRLPQFGEDHRAERDHLDRLRLDQRLCADLLALQGRQPALRHPGLRRLRALPGGDLSADHRAELGRAVSHRCPASSSSTRSSACRS